MNDKINVYTPGCGPDAYGEEAEWAARKHDPDWQINGKSFDGFDEYMAALHKAIVAHRKTNPLEERLAAASEEWLRRATA